ncbi:uncharacterized protein B0H64DRAFT_448873 [Chaetomium fimeti]|uniref:Zn(2)-C6 fungal-type domain-containing protein n=1 Tax=Chaetomium fimeti TaxID=1854472 RepID=A0AAE0HQ46_9PEZI|nr:hypothetical protein B0H64DRAFT_448873 [Chaetomium fimeti]
MKRRAVDPAEESSTSNRRRQPQTSCDSCRKRKLKCDRGQPCSSCVARELPCHGQPSAKMIRVDQSPDPSLNQSILRRLRALEEAVFDNHNHKDRQAHPEQSSQPSVANTPMSSAMGTDGPQPARGTAVMPLGRLGSLKFGVLSPAPSKDPVAFSSCPSVEQGCVRMMPLEQAMALLQDYLDHVYPLLPIIHGPTSRDLIRTFYDGLSRGGQVTPQVAALILGMSAISAYFWQPDTGHHAWFASSKDASEASNIWRNWASDILDNTPKEPGNSTLEGVQAWTLLTFMVQNVEGCSTRFRFLHYCSLAAARELLIHVVDSPKADPNQDRVTRELKRRIWWYIAGTDWLLGFMGGPTEGTYSVQLRHMTVKYPRNMNDSDMGTFDDSTSAPVNMSTQMSYFLQRVRIGEIIREVLDTSHPGGPDVDITDYDKVLHLDRLFEQAFMDLPPFFRGQCQPSPRELDTLELQRVMIQLGLLARRARLHRPFLLQQCRYEPHHQRSRDICLKSTRDVVALAISTLQNSLNMDQAGAAAADHRRPRKTGSSTHRLGLVINHLSTSCTVLALYMAGANPAPPNRKNDNINHSNSPTESPTAPPTALPTHGQPNIPTPTSTTANAMGGNTNTNTTHDNNPEDAAAISDELGQACRVLGALAGESPAAADTLRNLVGLLKKYRAQGEVGVGVGVDGGGIEPGQLFQPQGGPVVGRHMGGSGQQQQQHVGALPGQGQGQQQQQGLGDVGGDEGLQWPAMPERFVTDAAVVGDVVPSMTGGNADGAMAEDGGPLSLDGLWDGFVMGSSEDYNQLFTDLDYYCGIF